MWYSMEGMSKGVSSFLEYWDLIYSLKDVSPIANPLKSRRQPPCLVRGSNSAHILYQIRLQTEPFIASDKNPIRNRYREPYGTSRIDVFISCVGSLP